ncbi:MAG TPA: TIGR03118 family protein, partial [Pirellulales bacterium]|nr:TIGR03118 family protein [Pirellulales bacterium]
MLTSSHGYLQIPLAADTSGAALLQDANVQNAWGIALSPSGGPLWSVDAGSGVATRYLGNVAAGPFAADPPAISIPGISPTAIAFNQTGDFVVGTGNNAFPALFLFASQDGTISGWASTPTLSSQAQTATTVSGAEFTGLAVATLSGGTGQLYAADFHNAKIDVFNGSFSPVTLAAGAFTDPNLPTGYAPYNIQLINGQLYVTYGLQDAAKAQPQTGAGDGLVDIYNLDGTFSKRFVSNGGALNAPWGLAVAPGTPFGDFANDLLVANSGDGHILAYDPTSGSLVGMLNNGPGTTQPLTISGLHGIAFGNGATVGDSSTLFYTAGSGQHGQLGEIVNAFDQPLVVVPTPIVATEGATFSGTLATFNDSTTTDTASTFTALINWGDGTSQTTGSVTANT